MSALQEAGAACRNAEYELQEIHGKLLRATMTAPEGPAKSKAVEAQLRIVRACATLNAAAEAFYAAADKEGRG